MMYSCCGESLDIVMSSKSRLRTSSVVAIAQARWSTTSNYADNTQRKCCTSLETHRCNYVVTPAGDVAWPDRVVVRCSDELRAQSTELSWAPVGCVGSMLCRPAARAVVALVAPPAAAAVQHSIFNSTSSLLLSPLSFPCVVAAASLLLRFWDMHAETPTDRQTDGQEDRQM